MSNHKRLLIPLSFSFSIRYIIRTGLLREIRKFAQPVILLSWNEEDLLDELRADDIEVHVLPTQEKGATYSNTRRKIDIWFWHKKLKYPSKSIQEKYLNHFKTFKQIAVGKLIRLNNIYRFYLPGCTKKLFSSENVLLNTDTNYSLINSFVTSLKADAVFTVTPFHNAEDLLLRACKNNGLKMFTAILSFDNITKRGWIPVEYDVYMVWNKYNLEELNKIYPFTKNKNVFVTGAPQFDFYNNPGWLLHKDEWKKLTGIGTAENKKIILYGGGPKSLFPQEPEYLRQIDEAISNNEIKGNPIILFRCHPVDDIQRWVNALKDSSNIVFDKSWTGFEKLQLANVTTDDVKKLCSTLAYTDVHINICSTMAIDGSAYNKPQIAPAYIQGSRKGSRLLYNMYYQQHYKPIMAVKGVAIARNKLQLVSLINQALNNPEIFTKQSQKTVEEIITYRDGKATERILKVLLSELS